MPPPHHYEYVIEVGPGPVGKITFYPDYPMENPPVWEEKLDVELEKLDELHTFLAKGNMIRGDWEEAEDDAVGGRLEWMEIRSNGERHMVPSGIRDPENVVGVYQFIQSLVGDAVWEKLMAQRDEYMKGYAAGHGGG